MGDQGVTLEEALKEPTIIGEYMGKPVTSTSIKIVRAGDGLSKQMEIDPQVLVPGTYVNLSMRVKVGDHTHKLIEKADSWELVQQLIADTVTIDATRATESRLRKAADAVSKAAASGKGEERLSGMDAADLEPAEIEEEPPDGDGQDDGQDWQ